MLRSRIIKKELEAQKGWRVAGEAGGGREAIELVKKVKPDIAIVDITMPRYTGSIMRQLAVIESRVLRVLLIQCSLPER